jgi:hypothetical protein
VEGSREATARRAGEQALGLAVGEAPDHLRTITPRVITR